MYLNKAKKHFECKLIKSAIKKYIFESLKVAFRFGLELQGPHGPWLPREEAPFPGKHGP